MAAGCFCVGVVIALATIAASIRLHLNILGENAWMLAIPAVLAIIINIALIELYQKFKKKK